MKIGHIKASELLRIGDSIRILRKNKGWTQKKLASESGIHEVQIRRYENNQSLPRDEQLQKLASALGISINQLKFRRCRMKDYSQLHDNALDYERNIEIGAEQLCELRLKMYREKDADILKEITPVLNAIIHDAERYRNWIQAQN
nr:MAG TPA: helix-turn-helix domain protein [Caudoviricetes sp.]